MPNYQWARVGVKGALFRGEKLLLLHRRDDLDLNPGVWDMPGGGVEVGDGLVGALKREVREETGFSAQVGRPIHAWLVHSVLRSGEIIPGAIICFECSTRAGGEPKLDPEEHYEWAWVTKEEAGKYKAVPDQMVAIRKAFVGIQTSRSTTRRRPGR
jgi:8-oxo-dGTP pyrophosphatase MutT (NUDIX family)